MKILFVHQNFPGQFKHLAPELAKDKDNEVSAFTMNAYDGAQDNIKVIKYSGSKGTSPSIHRWLSDFETKTIRAEASFRAAEKLKLEGYIPDIIYAHPGWGEALFLKVVWPQSKLIIYSEYYYQAEGGGDTGFDPEFPADDPLGDVCRLKLKNLNNLLQFESADAGVSPTQWQKKSFPLCFREKIHVIHDGIDTVKISPRKDIGIEINGRKFTKADSIITFVNRNFEPYRGYHIFMRSLPEILKRNPSAYVFMIGGDKVSYGAAPQDKDKTWKDIFLTEVKEQLDLSRVFFLGNLPHDHFIKCLQISSCHVYLTYPFVLSWSLLEAMACGCPIIGSKTPPVEEVIKDGYNGMLVDFFSKEDITKTITEVLTNKKNAEEIGLNAREFVVANYDLKTICLPNQINLIKSFTS